MSYQFEHCRSPFSELTGHKLFAGVISYGVGTSTTSIAPWRLLFLVMGSVTVVWGVVLAFFLPDSPLQENFLKGKDKYIALSRIKENMTGVENRVSLSHHTSCATF